MAITDIKISEELETGIPSIKYRGNEGPKSPKEEKRKIMAKGMGYSDEEIIEYENYRRGMEEGKPGYPILEIDEYFNSPFSQDEGLIGGIESLGGEMQMAGNQSDADEHSFRLFNKPFKELSPSELDEFWEEMERLKNKFTGPILPSDEDPVNPFQPTPQGPVLPDRQLAAYGGIMGVDGRKQYGIGSWFQKTKDKFVDDIIPNEIKDNPLLTAAIIAGGANYIPGSPLQGFMNPILDKVRGAGAGIYNTGKRVLDMEIGDGTLGGSIKKGIASNILPIVGGLTAGLFTKGTEEDTPGIPSDNTALQLADLKRSANLLDQKQGLTAGLNFLPAVSARKFTPAEMAIQYTQSAANGGRIGFDNGGGTFDFDTEFDALTKRYVKIYQELGLSEAEAWTKVIDMLKKDLGEDKAEGGRIGRAEGGLMDLGGMEKDYRAEGGFVPIGAKEKADDVPARLSVNEFVFTADAVRNAGGGDVDKGAEVMENVMKHLEGGGQMSQESQGMGGAREMFETSERLSEVI
jgi:hypothetical protein